MTSYLVVDGSCRIPLDAIEWSFSTSSGPGGQHANRSNTRAIARLEVSTVEGLTDTQRRRLIDKHGETLMVSVDETRSQHRNRELALDRLRQQVAAARVVRKGRKATKPSRAAKQRRLTTKRRRSDLKSSRRKPKFDE